MIIEDPPHLKHGTTLPCKLQQLGDPILVHILPAWAVPWTFHLDLTYRVIHKYWATNNLIGLQEPCCRRETARSSVNFDM